MEDTIRNLAIISTITSGKTLCVTSMTVVSHNSWSSSFYRTYNGENRKNTLETIKRIILEGIELSNKFPEEQVYYHIENALIGLSNLKETYKDDFYIVSDIDTFLETVRKPSAEIVPIKETEKKPNGSNNGSHSEQLVKIPDTARASTTDTSAFHECRKEGSMGTYYKCDIHIDDLFQRIINGESSTGTSGTLSL